MPLMPGQFEVGDDQVELIGIEEFEGGFGVGDGLGAKVLVCELKFEEAAHFGFVFDDEDGGLFGHFSGCKNRNKFAIRKYRRSLF